MSAYRIIDGITVRLVSPSGFVDAATVYPAFVDAYQREQDVLAVYLDACHAVGDCGGDSLPDPFVEVLVPEKKSPLRRVEPLFFEACKLEVERSIRGGGIRPEEASIEEGRPLPPLATFTDGPGWFACCTLRYKEDCYPVRVWDAAQRVEKKGVETRARRKEEKGAQTDGEARTDGEMFFRTALVPCLTGNVVFVNRGLPVIVNIHRGMDNAHPAESFEWVRKTTDDYCRELLPLNGVALR